MSTLIEKKRNKKSLKKTKTTTKKTPLIKRRKWFNLTFVPTDLGEIWHNSSVYFPAFRNKIAFKEALFMSIALCLSFSEPQYFHWKDFSLLFEDWLFFYCAFLIYPIKKKQYRIWREKFLNGVLIHLLLILFWFFQ